MIVKIHGIKWLSTDKIPTTTKMVKIIWNLSSVFLQIFHCPLEIMEPG